jgi:hypothetical protein
MQWRVLPTGQRERLGADGQWYPERCPIPDRPAGWAVPPPAVPQRRRREPLLSGPGKAVAVVVVLAILAAGIGVGLIIHTRPKKDGVSPTQLTTAPASCQLAVTRWIAQELPIADTIATDLQRVLTDISAAGATVTRTTTTTLTWGRVAQVKLDCQSLGTAVSTAQSLPAAPTATAEEHWSAALTDLASASQECQTAVSENDGNLLIQSVRDLTRGVDEVSAMAGSPGR